MAAENVDSYINEFEGVVKERLKEIRGIIKNALPEEAEERISYAIPAFKLKRYVVYFAGYAKHVSMYPMPEGDESYSKAISPYLSGKATARFPHDKPLPKKLIEKTVKLLIIRSNEWGK